MRCRRTSITRLEKDCVGSFTPLMHVTVANSRRPSSGSAANCSRWILTSPRTPEELPARFSSVALSCLPKASSSDADAFTFGWGIARLDSRSVQPSAVPNEMCVSSDKPLSTSPQLMRRRSGKPLITLKESVGRSRTLAVGGVLSSLIKGLVAFLQRIGIASVSSEHAVTITQ